MKQIPKKDLEFLSRGIKEAVKYTNTRKMGKEYETGFNDAINFVTGILDKLTGNKQEDD